MSKKEEYIKCCECGGDTPDLPSEYEEGADLTKVYCCTGCDGKAYLREQAEFDKEVAALIAEDNKAGKHNKSNFQKVDIKHEKECCGNESCQSKAAEVYLQKPPVETVDPKPKRAKKAQKKLVPIENKVTIKKNRPHGVNQRHQAIAERLSKRGK